MYLDARRQPPADLLKLHIYKSSGGYPPLILLKVTNIYETSRNPLILWTIIRPKNLKIDSQKIVEFMEEMDEWMRWKSRMECAFD